MMLNYFFLLMLVLTVALVVYGGIAVYSIPYEIAKARNHPHLEAIGAATWVSLLTAGLLWPFLWIWALLYRPGRGWGFGESAPLQEPQRLDAIESRLAALVASSRS